HPIGASLHDRVPEVLEPLHGPRCRARPERRAKTLVGALVQVDAGQEFGIEDRSRIRDRAAVIGERRVNRTAPRRRFDNEAIEPFRRNEVEQRRCSDKVERTVKRQFKIAGEIDRAGDDVQLRQSRRPRNLREETEIVVDQSPVLARRQMRTDRAQRGAGAAGEVDDRDRRLIEEGARDRVEHGGVTRREIIGLAQSQPPGGKAAHWMPASTRANSAACPLHDGNALARAPAARRSRSAGSSMRRWQVAARAWTSSGGTSTPAPPGIVSGMAPALVPTTGTPWAMASA